jgi:hypothetical protein
MNVFDFGRSEDGRAPSLSAADSASKNGAFLPEKRSFYSVLGI